MNSETDQHTTEGNRPISTTSPSAALRAHAPNVRVTEAYDAWWKFAFERQQIYYRRLRGDTAPWTEDPILQRFRFTNVFRAADRVSQYLIRNVIYSEELPRSANEIAFRVLLFKLFNRIETWETIVNKLGPVVWSKALLSHIDKLLTSELSAGRRIYSAAYIMPTKRLNDVGIRKHQTHLELLGLMMADQIGERLANTKGMKAGFDLLRSYPNIGDFLAYQFVTDLNYSEVTNYPETEFVAAGPGAREGLRKCFTDFGGLSDSELIHLMMEIQDEEFERLGLNFQGLFGRPLQLIDCQNLFCEVAKYSRVRFPNLTQKGGRFRIKQKYRHGASIEKPFFPPKWNINQAVRKLLSPCETVREPDLTSYQREAAQTSFHEPVKGGDSITTSLLGIIGEIGEVVSELKKHSREGAAYLGFSARLTEEVGDVLWYVSDLATRRHIRLDSIASTASAPFARSAKREGEWIQIALSLSKHAGQLSQSYDALLSGTGLSDSFDENLVSSLAEILNDLTGLTSLYGLSLPVVAAANLEKVNFRWKLPTSTRQESQNEWPEDEQIPMRFDAWISDTCGCVSTVFLLDEGRTRIEPDQLTDNAYDSDGYRFHDIFHLAYAAVLGWSPVTRSLIRRKRKSDPYVDEIEDGGRAIAIEEGIAAMVFAYAAQHHMFRGVQSVDYSLLRTIKDMTAHLEVSVRSAAEWQDAIIQGFEVWRSVRDAAEGHVLVNRASRTIRFEHWDRQPSPSERLSLN